MRSSRWPGTAQTVQMRRSRWPGSAQTYKCAVLDWRILSARGLPGLRQKQDDRPADLLFDQPCRSAARRPPEQAGQPDLLDHLSDRPVVVHHLRIVVAHGTDDDLGHLGADRLHRLADARS